MGVEFFYQADSCSWSAVDQWVIIRESNWNAEFFEVAVQELPVMKLGIDFEDVVERVHFNFTREVTGEHLSH